MGSTDSVEPTDTDVEYGYQWCIGCSGEGQAWPGTVGNDVEHCSASRPSTANLLVHCAGICQLGKLQPAKSESPSLASCLASECGCQLLMTVGRADADGGGTVSYRQST